MCVISGAFALQFKPNECMVADMLMMPLQGEQCAIYVMFSCIAIISCSRNSGAFPKL